MKVNEIFYSLQGEGYFTGVPAVFVRFAGCNLACPFCDTDHGPFREMTPVEIVEEIRRLAPGARHVVLTGGEPAMHMLDAGEPGTEANELATLLKCGGYFLQMETNGTLPVGEAIDWVTCSPKLFADGGVRIAADANEVKLLFMGEGENDRARIDAVLEAANRFDRWPELFLQPCDHGDAARNAATLRACIDYIKAHPQWRLSLQTHKLLNIP